MKNSNTFRNRALRGLYLARIAAGLATVCFAVSAVAIDANRPLSQYIRSSWGVEKGFPGGSISSIAQTSDGYLWIGTDKGLVRFDGVNFRRFEQANPSSFPIAPIQTMLADGQGNLWILLRSTKVLRYRDGKFELSRGEAENGITAMGRANGNTVLLSSITLGTLIFNGDRFVRLSSASTVAPNATKAGTETPDELSTRLSWSAGLVPHRLAAPAGAVTSIEAADGRIWLGTEDGGLFHVSGGLPSTAAKALAGAKITFLLPVGNSELWIGTGKGVFYWSGKELTQKGVPSSLQHVDVRSMLRDRDSNIWVGTTRGLFRFNSNGLSLLSGRETNEPVAALFEDREGNIWVGSGSVLERLRDSAFVTYSFPHLNSQSMGSLYIDPDGRTWAAPIEGGLLWLKGGKEGAFTDEGIAKDVVYSITGGRNDLWIGRQRGGLTHLRVGEGPVSGKTYKEADGLAQNSVYAVYESRDGTVWSGTLSRGVSEFRNGHFTTHTNANGLASNTVLSIAEAPDGTMWFGTPSGLSEFSKNVWRSYTTREGLPSPDVSCLLMDSAGVLWAGTANGLAFLNGDRLNVPRQIPNSLQEQILGIAEDRNGWLWVATANHVLQVKRNSLMQDVLGDSDVREFGIADGLLGTEGVKRYRSVVADAQGRVWFSTNRGLSMVNAARATVNSAPALVHIDDILADGSPFSLRQTIRIPSEKQRTTIRYTGLSLSNSERVRYRYRLDGFDHGWSEPVTEREATYANLGVGSYRFRVMASNSDGLWNGNETAVAFAVEPMLWQTWWFRLGCVACAALIILLVYRVHMHQVTQLLNVRFEERLAERTRIAQELHDTFLQGVVSVSMQLHVAVEQLQDDSPLRANLNRIVKLTGQVVEEGRNTLLGLRSSIESSHDLKNSFSRIPQELGREETADFRVVVVGVSLPLRAAVRDDIYSIGREAVVNAFRHSGARNIAMHLEYAAHQLRITVEDDGRGIDSQFLQFGRDGHWGLSGMRERAERIGGKLRVLTRPGDGTEVELRVPSHIAWGPHLRGSIAEWLTGFFRQTKESTKSESNRRVER